MFKKRLFDLPIYDGELKPKPPHSLARVRQFLGYYDWIERTQNIRAIICCDDGKAYTVMPKFAYVKDDKLNVLYPHCEPRCKCTVNRVVYIDENGNTLATRDDKCVVRKGDSIAPGYTITPNGFNG